VRQPFICLCVVVVFCLCSVFVPRPEIAASNSAVPHVANAADIETSGEKPASTCLLRDPELPASNAAAMVEPDCSNCLIRLCLIGSNNKLDRILSRRCARRNLSRRLQPYSLPAWGNAKKTSSLATMRFFKQIQSRCHEILLVD
jgi:hypothetical protein